MTEVQTAERLLYLRRCNINDMKCAMKDPKIQKNIEEDFIKHIKSYERQLKQMSVEFVLKIDYENDKVYKKMGTIR